MFALISALPRGIALLALVTQVDVQVKQVLEEEVGFGEMIKGCNATGQVWTGMSREGRFHKAMVISDYGFQMCGLFLVFSSFLYGTFPLKTRATKAVSLCLVIVAAGILVNGINYVIQSHWEKKENKLWVVRYGPVLVMQLCVVILCGAVMLVVVLLAVLSQPGEASRSTCDRLRLVSGKLRLFLTVTLTLTFCNFIDDIQTDVLNYFGNASKSDEEYQLLGVFVPLALGKIMLFVMRVVTELEGDSLPLTTALMGTFLCSSFASMMARRFLLEQTDMTVLIYSCAIISVVEIMGRMCIFWLHLLSRGTVLQQARINRLPLDELLQVHDRMSHRIDVQSGHILIDQVCEIAVCFNCAIQNFCVPEWVVRETLDDYQTRKVHIFWSFMVQMVFELVVDYLAIRYTYRSSCKLIPFAQRVLWNKHLISFCFGLVIFQKSQLPVQIDGMGNTFWPTCTTCMKPWQCLLFIECSRGPVKLGTEANVCQKNYDCEFETAFPKYYEVKKNESLELLAIHNSHRCKQGLTQNLTLEDLGCMREAVDC